MVRTHWLITGGCGFIGTSLVKCILADNKDIQITVLDNLSVGTREDLAQVCTFKEVLPSELGNIKGIRLIVADVRNPEVVESCTKGIDCIVHLAANT